MQISCNNPIIIIDSFEILQQLPYRLISAALEEQAAHGGGGAVIEFVSLFPGVQDAKNTAPAAMPNHAQASALFILFAQPAAVFAHGGESFAVRRHVRKPPIVEIVEGLAQICDVYTHLRARDPHFLRR